ncbi:FMN-dependent NADH-azoreductase [Pseudalkalibacillus berkeleyi]|uniref:FMN dependent NADH:quinone oxidoreductase n=1 Tax=Pseudalkalibacillus berkeleyi TaxID=1069813 RepID=A0ABS9H0F7_9BACL|nr:FMN-dependent NADH-azoreductase [Pseudalkalibacillus berkeleyi]MCF6137501.1 FMN-dependent NADH-azoreductase [Pseudalkalibacillus berkeleyi]
MAEVLYITANPKSVEESLGLAVGEEFIQAYREENPEDEIIRLDLYDYDIPYIDTDVFNGWGKLQQGQEFDLLSPDEQDKVRRINVLTEQFKNADKYVFVTPLWNFSVPPKMKAYIDTVSIAGSTFKYTENGPVGLLEGKKALHIQARGGIYSEGPAADLEMGDRYIKAVMGFLGVTDTDSIIIEGHAFMPDKLEEIKGAALEKAKSYASQF